MKAISEIADYFEKVDVEDPSKAATACMVALSINNVIKDFNEKCQAILEKLESAENTNFDWNSLLSKPKDD